MVLVALRLSATSHSRGPAVIIHDWRHSWGWMSKDGKWVAFRSGWHPMPPDKRLRDINKRMKRGLMFDKIMTPVFAKDVEKLRGYDYDIRKILCENSLKDLTPLDNDLVSKT
jgi:hypothetical protein